MNVPSRRAESAQRRTTPIWVWPCAAGVLGFGLATVAARVDPGGSWARVAWPGDSDAASTLVQTVAGSVVTVTTLTFSLTVLALQLASQQFSPRLLREFTRDPVTRIVLSVLVGTFVLSLAVLRHLGTDAPVPAVAVLLVLLAGLASLAAVLGFITHIVRVLRVDTMMLAVHDESRDAINTFYPTYDDPRPRAPDESRSPHGEGRLVLAARSGFVRQVRVDDLVRAMQQHDCFVELMVRPGDHVVAGSPLAVVRHTSGGAPDLDDLREPVRAGIILGYERTLEQDAAFGFRQLEDIAVKALSPGINDPVTAAHAIGHMTDLLVKLVGCRLGPTVHEDDRGVGRAVVPDRDLEYYLELACGQVRRYGSAEPTVLISLLRLLRDVAAVCRDEQQREAVAEAARLIVNSADDGLLKEELDQVQDMLARVHAALDGSLVRAYSDRAGETRSI